MKVFLSWSGVRSEEIAKALADFLRSVIQAADPWVSSEAIRSGMTWNVELGENLDESEFGIICLTPENLTSPWILFEAGALGKRFGRAHVTPFLIGVEPGQLPPPLAQFHVRKLEKADVHELVRDVNRQLGAAALPDSLLDRYFERDWPDFERQVAAISPAGAPAAAPTVDTMVSEILTRVRELQQTESRTASAAVSLVKRQAVFRREAGPDGRPARPVTRRAIATRMSSRLGEDFPADRVALDEPIRDYGNRRVAVELDDGTVVLVTVVVKERDPSEAE